VIVRGDARALPLADGSVDLVITSPPYFALRSYTDDGAHYGGQVGAEPTPAEYVDALIECTREMVRVLKPSGSIWVNLGDKYAEKAGPGHPDRGDDGVAFRSERPRRRQVPGIRPKSLLGLPWRYALRCIDELGLILRAEVIWSKPNGLPESVTDRVRRSHEQWFHLVRSPRRYYSAVDRVREPLVTTHGPSWSERRAAGEPSRQGEQRHAKRLLPNALGALPGSVWTVATQPLKVPAELGVDHFAAFPMEFPRRIIQGWCPQGVCTGCGEGRMPAAEVGDYVPAGHGQRDASARRRRIPGEGRNPLSRHGEMASTLRTSASRTITGEVCGCPEPSAPTRPGVVLDPFGGTGTVALVAEALGRVGVSVDLSGDYCRLAQWRTNDPGQRAAALEVPKPPVQVDEQTDLLALFDTGEDAA
jgi:DNA modification methylase